MGNRKKWKKRFLVLSLIAGALYCAEERYSFFRLRELEIVPRGVLPDELVWQSVPAKTENFWLFPVWDGGLKERIESFYPVQVKLKVSGWGRYRLNLLPLEPFIYVRWNQKVWLVSKDGRMWLANLPANLKARLQLPRVPILEWDSGMPIPINTEGQRGDISSSSLPLRKIAGWMDAMEKAGWIDDVQEIVATKINGRPVVRVMLGSDEGIVGEIILKEDTSDWHQLAQAFKQKGIYPTKNGECANIEINATFLDKKFTVKTRTQGNGNIR